MGIYTEYPDDPMNKLKRGPGQSIALKIRNEKKHVHCSFHICVCMYLFDFISVDELIDVIQGNRVYLRCKFFHS